MDATQDWQGPRTVSAGRGGKVVYPAAKRQGGSTITGTDSLHKPAEGAAQAPDWAALVVRLRGGTDREAFAQLFRHFAPRVKAYLMKSGSDAATAEECAQDVMVTLWQKAHLFDPARASVATWIFTIARNRRIDLARKSRRFEPEDIFWSGADDQEPDQAEVHAAAEDARRLAEALAELPQAQKAMVERAFFGDLSHGEIAQETGLPLGTIKSRIRLGLDRLRARLAVKE